MHCSKCKTIIDKAILIAETVYGTDVYGTEDENIETLYCKKCFKQSFVNE